MNVLDHDAQEAPVEGLLSGYQVVDLADRRNLLCGRLLADMGATVIKVEDVSQAEASNEAEARKWWAHAQAYDVGKQHLQLDLRQSADVERLRELVLESDFLLESGAPGSLTTLGLDYQFVHSMNPRLVYVSVTPFGQSGPHSGFAGSDIVLQAMGGHMAVTGERDRAPLSMGVDVAYRHGGVEATAAAMLSHYHRERTGQGQHVDVSIQQCVIWTLLNSTMTPQLLNRNDERGGSVRRERGRDLMARVVWRCKDGVVHFAPIGGGGGSARARSYRRLVAWMAEEGFDDPHLLARDWNGKDLHSVTQDEYDRLAEIFSEFLITKTIAELYARAVEERLLLAPISRIPDLLEDPQLAARGAFSEIVAGDRSIRIPGRFAVMSRTPLDVGGAAQAVTKSANRVQVNDRLPRPTEAMTGGPTSVFSGIKVADFAWAAAGPIITKNLADHGATVIRVESTSHPDSVRLGGPFKDGIPGVNRSGFFADFNTSKKSIVLDMKSAQGRAIARRLVDWSDVVTESYTPGVMKRFGLSYGQLAEDRSDLVMLSTCMQGQDGPYANYAGYGGQGAALAGLHYVTGWPDLDPAGPKGAYTDAITPRFGIAAIAAALAYRRRTGQGQYIDLSQIEASLQFLAPEMVEYQLSGQVAGPMGNRSSVHSPHGAFPCLGDDAFVAIAVETDDQWHELATLIDEPWSSEERYRTVAGRLTHVEDLERGLREWTSGQDPYSVMYLLQRSAIPCGVVQRPSALFTDPQLAHRGHFWELEHAELGRLLYNGTSFRLSETPAYPRSAAPLLGEHTREVLTTLLGYSDAEVDRFGYEQVLQ
jgi:crotonobetainyl-CoA:carnitine CoA-transferase CaiB-like acyl-CoA transferase